MAEGDWSFFPGGGYAAAGVGGLGVLADLYAFIQNQQQRSQSEKVAGTLADPAKFSAYVNKTFQPMSAAENAAMARDYGANWATMTGGAPGGAFTQYSADALAKIESQRYNQAAQNALAALRGVSGAQPSDLPMGASSQMLKMLMALRQLRQQPSKDPSIVASSPTTDTSTVSPETPLPFDTAAEAPVG